MSDSLGVVYVQFTTYLIAPGAIWADQLWSDQAEPDEDGVIQRPYTVFGHSAGGEGKRRRQGNAEYVIDVTCVAEDLADAMTGAEQIYARLHNKGELDLRPFTPAVVVGDSQWMISTITAEERIHFKEPTLNSTTTLNYDGYRFRVIMGERIS